MSAPASDRDWGDIEQFVNVCCLGCMLEAREAGAITQDEYQGILIDLAAKNEIPMVPCPSCGQLAYGSIYEPSIAHCPGCGMYLLRKAGPDETDETETWEAFRQGMQMRRGDE